MQVVRSGNFYKLKFADRDSYTQSKTKEYDDLAMVYLSYVLYPLVIGYSIYSLIYESHKSWYSWILSSLTGCVYTFGTAHPSCTSLPVQELHGCCQFQGRASMALLQIPARCVQWADHGSFQFPAQ